MYLSECRYKTKKIIGKAVLKNMHSAIFYEHFHNGKLNEDYIYKLIANMSEKHMIDCNVIFSDFKFPYEENVFKFKNGNNITCRDKNNKYCLIEDCFDKDVVIHLQATPYNFTSATNEKIVGVSLKVLLIKLC